MEERGERLALIVCAWAAALLPVTGGCNRAAYEPGDAGSLNADAGAGVRDAGREPPGRDAAPPDGAVPRAVEMAGRDAGVPEKVSVADSGSAVGADVALRELVVAYTLDGEEDDELWLARVREDEESASSVLLGHRPYMGAVVLSDDLSRLAYIASESEEPESGLALWLLRQPEEPESAPERVSPVGIPPTYVFDNNLEHLAYCELGNPCGELGIYRVAQADTLRVADVGDVELAPSGELLALTDGNEQVLSWVDLMQPEPAPVELYRTEGERRLWFPRGRIALRARTLLFIDQLSSEPYRWEAYAVFLPDPTPWLVAAGESKTLEATLREDGMAVAFEVEGRGSVVHLGPGVVGDESHLAGVVDFPRMRGFSQYLPYTRPVSVGRAVFAWDYEAGLSRQLHEQGCVLSGEGSTTYSPLVYSSNELQAPAALHCNGVFGFVRFDEPGSFSPITSHCAHCVPTTFAPVGDSLFFAWYNDNVEKIASPHYVAFRGGGEPIEVIPGGISVRNIAPVMMRWPLDGTAAR